MPDQTLYNILQPRLLTHSTSNPLLRLSLPLQKLFLLNPTLLKIYEEQQEQETRQTQPKEEVKRRAVVVRRAGVDDGRRHEGSDKGTSFANDAEEREEEELFASGRDFGDHDLAVAVPGTDEKAVEGLVEPD